MKSKSKKAHLTCNDRRVIRNEIEKGSSQTDIANILGKDKSTISREIKDRSILQNRCSLILECANYKSCNHGRVCNKKCQDYVPFKCNRRDHSPGACNGCSNYSRCHFNKVYYDDGLANKEYRNSLKSSREGFNITLEEIKRIGNIIEEPLNNGQSISQILVNHPEIKLSIMSVYTYIEYGIFKEAGFNITSDILRRKPNRRIPKKLKKLYNPRSPRKYLNGRKYVDYQAYIMDHPECNITQMDTVYNNVSNGPFIQTFKFIKYGFLFAFVWNTKDAKTMNDGVLLLEKILGKKIFQEEVEVLLTDRGSEFINLEKIEKYNDSSIRTRVFYCDPMASCQKGSLENKHEELRYILPKLTDLKAIGLTSQDALNCALSHINSSPRLALKNRTPIEVMKFFNPEMWKKLQEFGLKEISPDGVVLRPHLLKPYRK